MRKFFVNLFYFSIVPLFIFGSIEICICTLKTRLFSENNLEKIYKNDAYDYDWIKSLKGDSLTVLAGSSSVKYGLSCKILNEMSPNNNKYVNIAMAARDVIPRYFMIKNLGIKNISAIYFGLEPEIDANKSYLHRNRDLYSVSSFFILIRLKV